MHQNDVIRESLLHQAIGFIVNNVLIFTSSASQFDQNNVVTINSFSDATNYFFWYVRNSIHSSTLVLQVFGFFDDRRVDLAHSDEVFETNFLV